MEQPLQRADLLRRLENLIRLGTVADVDYQQALVRVDVSELRTDWLPWLTARAGGDRDWWAPEIDEQVLLLAVSADPAQAVVLPAVYRDQFPPPGSGPDIRRVVFGDGANMYYDRSAHHLEICLPLGGTVHICATGDVTVDGDVIADGVSLKTHVHTEVKTGGDLSGPPAQ